MPAVEITDTKGLVQKTGTGVSCTSDLTIDADYVHYGQSINQMSMFGLNPCWAFNFGDPSVAASATEAGGKGTVLTPIGTLFNLSLALGKVASRTAETTVAESTELLGTTAAASTSPVAFAAGATNVYLPDNLNISRVSGDLTDNLVLTASTFNYQANESALMIFKGGTTIPNTKHLKLTMHTTAELNAEGTEVIVSGAGNNIMTRETAPTDADQIIILTATGNATILEGSYIYFLAENNSDEVNIKACIRTTGGTIGVSYGNP